MIKRIRFYANSGKPDAERALAELEPVARGCGLEVVGEGGGAADAVVVLGGDGTMLSAVHTFPGVPLLGLNLGTLGYLAGVEAPGFADAIRELAAGRFAISRRAALKTCGRIALNDVVVARAESGHAAVIELKVDDRPATRFFADGLVIATPTGSTAYSLSAGGPILLPDSQSLVITPICPHALTSRPLVIRDTSKFALRLAARPGVESLAVCADGEEVARLEDGDEVTVEKAEERVPLIELAGHDPFETLNRKLGWAGSRIG